jgi:hypothetical protein
MACKPILIAFAVATGAALARAQASPPPPPALPTLPTQYTALIEANIVTGARSGQSYTIHMHEWFDLPNDRARVDNYRQAGRGRTGGATTSIYNYGTNTYLHTDELGACTWGDIAHIPESMYGTNRGTQHLSTSQRYFRFGPDSNMTETYLGKGSARGITADVWRHFECRNGDCSMGNRSIDYYFNDPSWQLPEDGPPNSSATSVPLRVVLEGWRYENTTTRNCSCTDCSQPQRWGGLGVSNSSCPSIPTPPASWTKHTYYHVYEYVSFFVGPMDDWYFAQPCGRLCTSVNTTWNNASLPVVGCPWRCGDDHANVTNATSWVRSRTRPSPPPSPPPISSKPSMPTLPNQFSAVIETNIINLNLTVHLHEFYDLVANRTRTDLYHGDTGLETTSIFDFSNNRYWHSEQAAHRDDVSSCQWGLVEHVRGREFRFWDMEHTRGATLQSPGVSGQGQPHLTTSDEFFAFGRELGETYDGVHSVRGIMSDKWSRLDCKGGTCCEGNLTTNFYFSQAGWSLPEDNGERVPTRVEVIGSWYRNRRIRNCSCSDCTNTTVAIKRSSPDYDPACPNIINSNVSEWNLHQYHHMYDYVSFHVGAPADWHYNPPCNQTCTSYNQTYSTDTFFTDCVTDQTCACDAIGTCPVTRPALPPPPPTSYSGAWGAASSPANSSAGSHTWGQISHTGTANYTTGSAGGHASGQGGKGRGGGSTTWATGRGGGRAGSSQVRTCLESKLFSNLLTNATTSSVTFNLDIIQMKVGSPARATFETNFKSDVAALLNVTTSRIVIVSMRPGSLVVTFAVLPDTDGTVVTASAVTTALTSGGSIANNYPTVVNGSPAPPPPPGTSPSPPPPGTSPSPPPPGTSPSPPPPGTSPSPPPSSSPTPSPSPTVAAPTGSRASTTSVQALVVAVVGVSMVTM